ncbi:hypothetical protein [Nonomuraea typhae]|uniref:Uncharacterized protein n=1 Tax=Nonomuraea typhae TaxID=2603600 RepID=A0ABW7ZA37_9ACTN
MNFKKSLTVAAAIIGGAIALTLPAAPATATSAAMSPCTIDTPWFKDGWLPKVDVQNICMGSIKVRVIWDYAHDSDCVWMSIGEKRTFAPTVTFGRFNRTETC